MFKRFCGMGIFTSRKRKLRLAGGDG